MKTKPFPLLLWGMACLLLVYPSLAQETSESKTKYTYQPLTLKLSEDGSAYVRFIIWNQLWLQTNNLSNDSDFRVTPSIRRARILAYAQMSPRFLLLTHFGMNSESAAGLDPLGENDNVSLFFHGAWGEYHLGGEQYMGLGIHYWNGLSRLTSASTLNFMTIDAPLFNWAQLGLSDQFARHLGGYAKGVLGKFHYRLSLNDALTTSLDVTRLTPTVGVARYAGKQVATDSLGDTGHGFVAQGYFNYNFLDAESYKLPYFVGTYLGSQRVFNVGVGFFHHTEGTVSGTDVSNYQFYDVNHLAIDAFYDAPVGSRGAAINALLAYYNYDFGPNYVKSAANPARTIATGNLIYAQFGFLLPGQGLDNRFMPYLTYANGNPEAFEDNAQIVKLGLNYFMHGHNSKLSLEYESAQTPQAEGGTLASGQFTLQLHVFL